MKQTKDIYSQPENWPAELVKRLDSAYHAMETTVDFWINGIGTDTYYQGMLCRGCRDLICNAVREKFGRDENPLILEFEGHIREMRYLKFKMRDKLKEGEYPTSPKFNSIDSQKVSGENLIVREFAIRFIEEKHEGASNEKKSKSKTTAKGLKGKKLHAFEYIKENGPKKGLLIARSLNIEENTFLSHYVPELKKHGVKNDGNGDGYYVPEDL